ncbi:MAG: dTDP-4-dehydrorhamnose 3,5-epimerase [Bacteroidota bacterium]|jgi:dTDP-4-dehydrorhamnose 3,5-epimerase
MNFVESELKGLFIIEPKVFVDSRGYFFESFHQERFNQAIGKEVRFVQDNESSSLRGVLRGLHFQYPPYAQGKLVRVIEGSVLDVAVDIRSGSPTYGHYFSIELSSANRLQLWIPEGFAHGFVALEDNTVFQYKCTDYYAPQHEGCILWNDQELSINWSIQHPIISGKDNNGLNFSQFSSPFK